MLTNVPQHGPVIDGRVDYVFGAVYHRGGRMRQILKQHENIVLTVSYQTKYSFLKSGRGTIRTETRYSVQYTDEYQIETENLSGVYGIKTKAEALKVFKQVTRHGFGSLAQK